MREGSRMSIVIVKLVEKSDLIFLIQKFGSDSMVLI